MRILIVDSSIPELSRMESLLREACPENILFSFSDSQEALDFFKKGNPVPDTAFLAAEMPHLSGVELAEKLLRLKPSLNIIFTAADERYMKDAFSLFASGYLLKPFSPDDIRQQLAHLRYPVSGNKTDFYAKTFGEFDFFHCGKPISFSSVRAKEMLAYLIDRQGASVTKKELFAILFEDSEYSPAKQDYLKKIARSLKETLTRSGGEKLLIHTRNSYAVDTALFGCDLYDYQNSPDSFPTSFGYMEQYSWAEFRAKDLTDRNPKRP